MIQIAALLSGIGLACVLFRRTFLGIWVGMHLLSCGAALLLVAGGVLSGASLEGHLFGTFVIWMGIAQLVVGCALGVRLFYLRKSASLNALKSLKY